MLNNSKKNKIIIVIIILIIILIIFLSILFSYRYRKERMVIENKIVNYLEKKYHEKFKVKSLVVENNTYEKDENGEYISITIPSSHVYNFVITSSRLIEFKVIYVDYEDDAEYLKNSKYNIRKEGIYENYIYEYKIRDIKKEIKSEVLKKIKNSSNFSVSMDNMALNSENILIDYSLDEKDKQKLYNEYREFDKRVSNIDFYNKYSEISNGSSLIINLDVDDFFDKSNIDKLQKEVKKLVSYLQEKGYMNYDVNLNLNNYQICRITRYIEEKEEKIYMIFDYEGYSNVPDDEKLSMYLFN